jgi:hypothetical protein
LDVKKTKTPAPQRAGTKKAKAFAAWLMAELGDDREGLDLIRRFVALLAERRRKLNRRRAD